MVDDKRTWQKYIFVIFFNDLFKNINIFIDTNIGTIAAALNFTSYNCLYETFKTGSSNALNCHYDYPIFASHILFELHQNDTGSNRYMRVFYNG